VPAVENRTSWDLAFFMSIQKLIAKAVVLIFGRYAIRPLAEDISRANFMELT
jgi:hypothetical protein